MLLPVVYGLVLAAIPALADTAPAPHYANCTGINAISPKCRSSETAYTRDFFYIGGQYANYAALKSDIIINQMYVEKLTPIGGAQKPYPIVLFTAGVPSGAVRPFSQSPLSVPTSILASDRCQTAPSRGLNPRTNLL
jgi:hypothetical protein